MRNIYLVGFMGTGKTVVGKALARKKKWRFVDLDELIELRQKRCIRDIFRQEGEAYFRRLEHQTLKEITKEKGFVVACGGGVVINPDNIEIMQDSGSVVCLAATPKVILERTSRTNIRPLLNVDKPQEKIELLLKLRAPYYAKADFTIDTSGISVKEVVDKILQLIMRTKKRGS